MSTRLPVQQLLSARQTINEAARVASSESQTGFASDLAYVSESPERWEFFRGMVGYARISGQSSAAVFDQIITRIRDDEISIAVEDIRDHFPEIDVASLVEGGRQIVSAGVRLTSFPDVFFTHFEVCRSLFPDDDEAFRKCLEESITHEKG